MTTYDMLGIPKRQDPASTRSELRLHTRAGLGSTNIYSPYYTTVAISTGAAFQYSNSPVFGLVVTILEDGLYALQMACNSSGTSQGAAVISKNYTGALDASSIPANNRVCVAFCQSPSNTSIGSNAAHTAYLVAGTTIRPNVGVTNASAAAALEEFAITKVGN